MAQGSLRAGVLLLACAAVLPAQFAQLVSTDDGKDLYFISQLTLSGSASTNTEPRLYRIGPEGLSLFAERPPSLGDLTGSSSSDGISSPQVSGDGSLIGFTVTEPVVCNPFTPTCTTTGTRAQLRGARNDDLGPGRLQLSRNGRYALLDSTLLDLTTGQKMAVPNALTFARAIASDGSVLVQSGIWKNGQITPQPALSISDSGRVVISVPSVNPLQLAAVDLASHTTTVFAQVTATTLPVFMALSNDGRRALYRVTPLASPSGTAYVADTMTGQSTAVPLPSNELAIDGTISGDGTAAILVTNSGRIVRVMLATGAMETHVNSTVYFGNVFQLAIGSLAHLQTAFPGTVADWTGHIFLGDTPLPVLGVKPGEVQVLIPWEQPAGTVSLRTTITAGSPFQQSQTVQVSPLAPSFEPLDPGETAILPIKIVKGDWSGLQTTQPKAGDIVYIYMTGLGPVDASGAIGLPLACIFVPQTTIAQTVYAGLAPGFPGIYQAAFRMPADPNPAPIAGMDCKLGQSASFGFATFSSLTIP